MLGANSKTDGIFLFSCDRVDCLRLLSFLAFRLVVFSSLYFNRNHNFFFYSFVYFILISGEAEKVKTLIRLRAELSPLFTGKRNASKYAWA